MMRVLVLFIALSAAGAAAWLTLTMQSGNVREVAPATVFRSAEREILVSSQDIERGQKLDGARLRWQSWPADSVNAAFIDRASRPDAIAELAEYNARSRIVAGEPILAERIGGPDTAFMSAGLPSGKRAVAIRITAESTAGGFILPDDRVDVIHTIVRPGETVGISGNRSVTILRNVRVLAIDQRADDAAGEAAVVGKTATLELTPMEAEAITGAQASGTLSLSLRSAADADEVIEAEEMVEAEEIAPVLPALELPAAVPAFRTVRILGGSGVETVEIPEGGETGSAADGRT